MPQPAVIEAPERFAAVGFGIICIVEKSSRMYRLNARAKTGARFDQTYERFWSHQISDVKQRSERQECWIDSSGTVSRRR